MRDGSFRKYYGAVIIAVSRDGEQIKQRIGDIELQPGDTLLLETNSEFVRKQRFARDFLLVSPVADFHPVRHRKRWVALAILGGMVLSVAAGWLSMFKAAIRDNSPVVIPWHFALMMDKGEVPEEDYVVPLGKADIKHAGTDVTVVANSQQLKFALQVAAKLDGEISVEVFDPRSFVPFDMELLLASVAKTSRLVIVDEDWESGGFAATLSARVMEQGFDLLDAPVQRVTFPNMPIPGGVLEPRVMPNPERIEAAIRSVME